jgi:peptide deformylase
MQHEIDNINGTLPWDHLPVFEKREKIAEFQKMERP